MKTDRIIVVCVLILTAAYWYAIHQIREPMIGDPIGPRAIPKLLALGLLLSAVLLAIETWAKSRRTAKNVATHEPPRSGRTYLLIALVIAATLAYFFVFNFLGYAIATAIYLSGLMFYFNPDKARANLGTSIIFSLGTYVAFTRLFGAQLPAGLLPF